MEGPKSCARLHGVSTVHTTLQAWYAMHPTTQVLGDASVSGLAQPDSYDAHPLGSFMDNDELYYESSCVASAVHCRARLMPCFLPALPRSPWYTCQVQHGPEAVQLVPRKVSRVDGAPARSTDQRRGSRHLGAVLAAAVAVAHRPQPVARQGHPGCCCQRPCHGRLPRGVDLPLPANMVSV